MLKKLFGLIFVLSFIFVNGFTNVANATEAKIINFFPLEGKVGDLIIITGENFSSIDGVLFGSVDVGLNFTAVSTTQITAKVPPSAVDGKITVKTTNFGNLISTETFKITQATTGVPKIATISPMTGKVGDTITITGENFIDVSWVFFGTGSNITKTNSPTEITIRVPPDATSGKITVHTANGDAVSSNDFTVAGTTTPSTCSNGATDPPTCTPPVGGGGGDINTGETGFSGLVPKCNTGKIDPVTKNYENPCDFNSLLGGVNKFINFVLITLATPLFALILIYVGWLYLSAGGSSENVTKAKQILKNALIGYIIALAAWLIVKTILTALNFTGPMFLG